MELTALTAKTALMVKTALMAKMVPTEKTVLTAYLCFGKARLLAQRTRRF